MQLQYYGVVLRDIRTLIVIAQKPQVDETLVRGKLLFAYIVWQHRFSESGIL